MGFNVDRSRKMSSAQKKIKKTNGMEIKKETHARSLTPFFILFMYAVRQCTFSKIVVVYDNISMACYNVDCNTPNALAQG